ncbi:MAG: DUF1697 domain-containing protein [Reinekea sp.]|nr:DUF1697 domain-containing protein [Reinekea sp.]
MTTYIALLRGINVGGKNKLRMEDLKNCLETCGFKRIKTYIQSGNVVFDSPIKNNTSIEQTIQTAIHNTFQLNPDVIVVSKTELDIVVSHNPYPTDSGTSLHVYFLKTPAASPDFMRLEQLKKVSEDYTLTDNVLYLHAPEGIGRSKLAAAIESSLGVSCTARNWNTLSKLQALSAPEK